jgi:hypothetical protein
MSWQDELQQLDSALASGQISADEYRIRRDRAIAQASGQSAPEQNQPPAGEATQVVRPVSPPHGERTQIVPPVGGGGGADRTQVVGGHDNSSDSTQVVPGAQAAGHQPQFPPPPPPPPWETGHPQQQQQPQQNMSAPPWGGEDSLPPEFGQQSWPTQGPEVFEESGSGNTGRTIAIVVAAILVIGLIGAGVWYFGFNNKSDDGGGGGDKTQAKTTEKTTKETPEKANLPEGPFIELKGDIGGKIAYMGTRTAQEAIAANSPSKADVPVIQNGGVESVSGLVADDDEKNRVGIWAFKVADGGDPAALLQSMDQVYNTAGFALTQEDGVLIRQLENLHDGVQYLTIRAHYVTKGGYMVRLESVGPNKELVQSRFDELKKQMLEEYPPET